MTGELQGEVEMRQNSEALQVFGCSNCSVNTTDHWQDTKEFSFFACCYN
jgi:hypothetical protein